mgnify:CR=1 FL=1
MQLTIFGFTKVVALGRILVILLFRELKDCKVSKVMLTKVFKEPKD